MIRPLDLLLVEVAVQAQVAVSHGGRVVATLDRDLHQVLVREPQELVAFDQLVVEASRFIVVRHRLDLVLVGTGSAQGALGLGQVAVRRFAKQDVSFAGVLPADPLLAHAVAEQQVALVVGRRTLRVDRLEVIVRTPQEGRVVVALLQVAVAADRLQRSSRRGRSRGRAGPRAAPGPSAVRPRYVFAFCW